MKKSSLHQAFEHLCEKLKIEGKDMGRVLIFCRKYTEVTALYFFFKHTLKECFIYPAGSPDYIQNRHSCNVVFDVQKVHEKHLICLN